jgi:hypothetical protein
MDLPQHLRHSGFANTLNESQNAAEQIPPGYSHPTTRKN